MSDITQRNPRVSPRLAPHQNMPLLHHILNLVTNHRVHVLVILPSNATILEKHSQSPQPRSTSNSHSQHWSLTLDREEWKTTDADKFAPLETNNQTPSILYRRSSQLKQNSPAPNRLALFSKPIQFNPHSRTYSVSRRRGWKGGECSSEQQASMETGDVSAAAATGVEEEEEAEAGLCLAVCE